MSKLFPGAIKRVKHRRKKIEIFFFDKLLTLKCDTKLTKTRYRQQTKLFFRFFPVYVEIFGKCFTPDQYKGDCVYFKSCPPLLEIYNKRPASTQDRLYLSLSQCGFRDGQPLVCCKEYAPVTQAPPPQQPSPPPQNVPVAPAKSLLPKPGECGIDAENRIYGGNATFIDEYPWMALLQYSKRKNTKLVCES